MAVARMGLAVALLILICATIATCRPAYKAELPNTPPGAPAVGHVAPSGGGGRNQFGVDFFKAGKTWTADLCKKDSDGDGFTNGQELGDPDCKWKKGMPLATKTMKGRISHPGVAASTPLT